MPRVRPATLLISLDLPASQTSSSFGTTGALCDWLEHFDALGLNATWCLESPASSALANRLMRSRRQEVALWLDDRVTEGEDARRRLAQALMLGVGGAAHRGLPIRSVACGMVPKHDLDLFSKHGIIAIRGRGGPAATAREDGLVGLPFTHTLDGGSAWSTYGRLSRASAALRGERRWVHLRLSAVAVLQGGLARRLLLRFFARCARRHQAGQLVVSSMGELAAGRLRRYAGTPARSILRAA